MNQLEMNATLELLVSDCCQTQCVQNKNELSWHADEWYMQLVSDCNFLLKQL